MDSVTVEFLTFRMCLEIPCFLFAYKLNYDVFVSPIIHSSLASMTSSTESRYWPSYVLSKIKSLWSVGGSNAGLNQLAASTTGMLMSDSCFACLLCDMFDAWAICTNRKDVMGVKLKLLHKFNSSTKDVIGTTRTLFGGTGNKFVYNLHLSHLKLIFTNSVRVRVYRVEEF